MYILVCMYVGMYVLNKAAIASVVPLLRER